MVKKNADKIYAKKFRGNWGAISPITKVIPNKKKKKQYDRHLEKDAYSYSF